MNLLCRIVGHKWDDETIYEFSFLPHRTGTHVIGSKLCERCLKVKTRNIKVIKSVDASNVECV